MCMLLVNISSKAFFFFQAEDGIRDSSVTGVQTCALPICERNRVHLAKTLTEGANVLLLDEPTNDLDVNTLRALEESLEEFAGTAVVVSHDRWFLDRICTHLIVFEGDSIAKMYVGNWSDYEAFMMEKFGKDLTPHRVKYRTLKR